MASTLSQKWLSIYCPKAQHFVYFLSYDFVQILPVCGPNTYQTMYWEDSGFNVSISNGNIKCQIGKPIFTVNFPLKLYRATVANADTGNLQSLRTFILVRIWTTCWRNLNQIVSFEMFKIWGFLTKTRVFFKHFKQSIDAILQDVSVAETVIQW